MIVSLTNKHKKMENQLIKTCSNLLQINRFYLFLLIACPIGIGVFTSDSMNFSPRMPLMVSIGGIILLAWIFAIGHKAHAKLLTQGKPLALFNYFNSAVIAVVLTYLLVLFFAKDVYSFSNGIHIHYASPVYLPILFIIAYLITIFIAAKTLVSAELNSEGNITDYFSTVLLFIISAIGVWFIQPRIQKL